MKLRITSWRKTLRQLGSIVVDDSTRNRRHTKAGPTHAYTKLEPRQMLAGDSIIQVVDRGTDQSFQYDIVGDSIDTFSIHDSRNARGATTSPDGTRLYILDSNKRIFVFDNETGAHLGTWRAERIGSVQGIATDGNSIWIVEKGQRRVHFFENAADLLSGHRSPTSDFRLDNKKPTGITTDGETIWVVDDKDRVYVYSTNGDSLGNWRLDKANKKPTGIAIDPSGKDRIWVLDEKKDKVYVYDQGRHQMSGKLSASNAFSLLSTNRKAEGIAIRPSSGATNAPGAPTIHSISSDTGLSDSDGLTNDATLMIFGTSDPGVSVELTDANFGPIGIALADEFGNWILDATSTILPDGEYLLTATASNGTDTSGPSDSFAVVVDTVASDPPLIVGINEDTGDNSNDGVTSDVSISLFGKANANEFIHVVETTLGMIGTTVVDSDGNWALELPGFDNGRYELFASAVDLHGNVSAASPVFGVVVDTIPPQLPEFDLDPLFDSSPSGDQTTDRSSITLAGTTEPGASVVLFASLGPVGDPLSEATADSNGKFFFTTISLSPGQNKFHVFASDLAGNESTFSQTITSTALDYEAPVVYASLLNDTGQVIDDEITTDPTLIGFIEDSSPVTVELWFYSYHLDVEYYADITTKLANGEFELDQAFFDSLVGSPLPFGEYYYYIYAEDSNENYDYYDGEFRYVEFDDGDFIPPQVTIGLLNDTGESNADDESTDGSLAGVVIDQNPITVSVAIADSDDLQAGVDHVGDITDLIQMDGTYIIPQHRLESILGRPLVSQRYFVEIQAEDELNVGQAQLEFDFINLTDPPDIDSVISDSGRSDTDGITNDTTLTITGSSYPFAEIELIEASLGIVGRTLCDGNGDWTVSIPGEGIGDGDYEFTASFKWSSETSVPSDVFQVTIDTESPLRAIFDLEPAFDTGAIGDTYTTAGLVTLAGTTVPGIDVRLSQTGQTTVADAEGNFVFEGVQLELGRHVYEIETFDLAGNKTTSRRSIAFDQPLILSETGFINEATQMIRLGHENDTRTVTFAVEAEFGPDTPSFEDTFAVYLVDPENPAETLLDRGVSGTALFSLVGDRPEYTPGQVRFDGSVVEIDVSTIKEFSDGMLLFQLIDNDGDSATNISIHDIGTRVDQTSTPGPVLRTAQGQEPGAPFDVSGLTTSPQISTRFENVRYESTTNKYIAEIRVQNDGSDIGRLIAVTFDDLASDITLSNASGINGNGNPYVSMRDAIPTYGLLAGQSSRPVRVEFSAPTVSPLAVAPLVSTGGLNSSPKLDPIGVINVMPGEVYRVNLSADDSDGEGFYYSIRSLVDLPDITLTATGQLVIAPTPSQIGSYAFEVLATDGLLSHSQTVTLNVVADTITTTRISGLIMDTHSIPLAGIPVELGGNQVLTSSDGSFELTFAGPLLDDTLKIHGEAFAGPEVYPFIAEKLPLLYGHDAYENVNNFIERPIYLPALDVANGVSIDPAVDVTVTTSAIPNASVFVAAGSLESQGGGAFVGELSITEVPADFTPAALPANLFPDLVVTIQPGEMIFTTPAPLNLPNLTGYFPGTEMTLWSINPDTGLFDDVGVGIVSVDGSTIETVSGGINNSSWHFFAPAGPVIKESNPRNQDKESCSCESTHNINENETPPVAGGLGEPDTGLDTEFLRKLVEAQFDANKNNSAPTNRGNGPHRRGLDGGWGTGGKLATNGSAGFGPYGSFAPSKSGPSVSFGGLGSRSNVTPSNNPILEGNGRNANETEVSLHSGAVYKTHKLAPYQSLSSWHGLQLSYDSERADARPIVSTGFDNIQNNLTNPTLVTNLAITRGNLRMEVPGFMGHQNGLRGGEHFFGFPEGATSLDIAIQADMRSMPTGVYEYESTNRFSGSASGAFTGTASTSRERLVHVNSIESPFGAGWGLDGLLEIVEDSDGSVLIIDGSGNEELYEPPSIVGGSYQSPKGDFSTLIKLADGRFRRTHIDQTVEQFSATNRLTRITDRNGNETQFQYDSKDNIAFIVDPVGLTTSFRYSEGNVVEIEDPAGRVTKLSYKNGDLIGIQDPDSTVREFVYDSIHRLTGEVDKLAAAEHLTYGFSGRIESITRRDGSMISYSPLQTQALKRPDYTDNLTTFTPAADLGPETIAKMTDGNGNVTNIELDKAGQLLASVDSEGRMPEFIRNDQNMVERVVDGRGNVTTIVHDERGNVVSISDPIARGAAKAPLFGNPIYPVEPYTSEVATADLNNDGFVDIISHSGSAGDGVSVLLGHGAGGFDIGVTFDLVDPVSLNSADVNGDGNLDVVTTNSGNRISVLLGDGKGNLLEATYFATGIDPQRIESTDLNRDGFVDLVTTNGDDDTLSVLLGDGTGNFGSFESFAVADSPRSLAIDDINNDNALDIVVGNVGSTNGLTLLFGDNTGRFTSSRFVATENKTEFVVLTDVTGDGVPDIITGDSDLVLLPGKGDGTFGPADVTATGSSAGANKTVRSIAIDVDLDGDQDLVFTDSSVAAMLVFDNDGKGNFAQGQSIGSGGNSMSAADANADGIVDIVVLEDGIVSVFGNGDGTFVDPHPLSSNNIPTDDGPISLDVADFNNDGHDDIVVATYLGNTVTTMLGAGDGTLTPLAPIQSANLILFVASGDLDGDGNSDIVTTHFDSDTVEVRYGDGTGSFSAPTSIEFPGSGPREVKIGDFNNDSVPDIVTVGYRGGATPGFSIFFNNGDRTFTTGPLIDATFQSATIDVGDIDNDGNLDVVVGVSYFNTGNAARPYLGRGDGTFVDQGRLPFGGGSFDGSPRQLRLHDLDGDGKLDIVGVDESQSALKVLMGAGSGTFEAVVTYAMDDGPRTLDVGDVNNDGFLDVIATNRDSDRVSIFFGRAGKFQTRRDFIVGDGTYSVKLVDLDENGSLDFVSTNLFANTVSIRINSTDISRQAARSFEFDPVFNQTQRIVDEQGRQVVYDIDPANGNTLSVTQVIGHLGGGDDIVTSYSYLPNGLVETITDPLGRITDLTYNKRGLLERVTLAVGTTAEASIAYQYDAAGNQTVVVDELDHRTEYNYDALNRVTQVTEADPDGGGPLLSPITTNVYDQHGNLIRATDALNNTTRFVYNENHQLTETIDAHLQVIRHVYDETGNLIATIDRLGRRTEFIYDQRNRLVETVDPSGGRSSQAYDPDNNVVAMIDENGVLTRNVYDSRNRLTRTTNALGGTNRYRYDRVNNLTVIIDELGRRTEMAYDELDRVTTLALPDPDRTGPQLAPITTYAYDAANNLVLSTDALGNSSSMEYDDRDRLVVVTDSDPDGAGTFAGPVWTNQYDIASRLIQTTDPLGRKTSFVYDRLGRLTTEILPDPDGPGPLTSPSIWYSYDSVHNRRSVTDALGNTTEIGYDNLYRVVSTTEADPDGSGPSSSPVTTYVLDAEGQIKRMIDPLGRTTVYTHDLLGRVVTETLPDPDGIGVQSSPVLTHSYDRIGNEVEMIDALGNTTRYVHDDLYRLVSLIAADPDGVGPESNPVTITKFDAAHQIVSTTDPLGRKTGFQYDDLGRVILETHPDPDDSGPVTSPTFAYAYDLMNNRLSVTDALGNATEYSYDRLYRLISTTEADPDDAGIESNPITTYAYDLAGQLTSTIDPLGRRTVSEYDDLGRLIRLIKPDPDGAGPSPAPVISHTYDSMGNHLSVTDSLGNVTNYEYDALDRITSVVQADPDGAGPQSNPMSTVVYDIAGQIISTTDALGRTSTYDYDALGRITTELLPDPDGAGPLPAPQMTHSFDLMNNEISVTDAVGNSTHFDYDNLFRLIRVVKADPDGAGPLASPVEQYAYDIANQLVTTIDPLNRTTANVYDNLGRIIRVTQPDPDGAGPGVASETNYAYDLMDNQTSITDPLGNSVHYEYDNLYRVIRERGPDLDGDGPLTGSTTEYSHDLMDNLISYTDSNGNQTVYSYDDLDRVFAESIELGSGNLKTRRFEYDLENNLIRRTDRNDRVTEHTFDHLHRMVEERWIDESNNIVNTIQFEFDEASQLLQANDLTVGSTYQYAYDNLGRTIQTVVNNGGPELVFANVYDSLSRRTGRSASVDGIPDYRNIYRYDGLDRVDRLDQSSQAGGSVVADKRIEFSYNADSQLTLISRYRDLAGGTSNLVFDSDLGYDGMGRFNELVHTGSTATIVEYDWTYDSASRITRVDNSVDGISDFNYDHGNQLTFATHASRSDETYQYDQDGNRTNSGYSTGVYNRLTSDGTFDYQYDGEGNRTNRTRISSGEVTEYEWDHRNRLITITDRSNADGPVTQTVRHRYDTFNRWISKSVDIDGDGLAAPEITRYEYDGDQIVMAIDETGAVTNRYLSGPLIDQVLVDEQVGNQVHWIAADHQGTVRDVVDSTGKVLDHIVYDSFGNVVSSTNTSISSLIGYTGRAFDETTGLQYNLNRWYDSQTGRWASEDPISFAAGDSNLYRYVGNDAVNQIDPDGLMDFWNSRLGRGLSRIHNQPLESARVFVDPVKRSFETSAAGRFGLELGETTIDLTSTVVKATNETLPYLLEDIGPAVGELAAIQVAKLAGKPALAEAVRRNSRFSQTRDLERYIASQGAAKTRAMLKDALLYAEISADIYEAKKGSRIQGFDLKRRFEDEVWRNSGFQAGLYFNPQSGKYILAYAGTTPQLLTLDGRRDVCQNIKQGFGRKTEQYELAIKLAEVMKKRYGDDLMLTGHSLGGGLATAASLVNDLPAYVIDPSGVHAKTIARHGANFSRVDELVNGIRLHGEFLTTFVNTAPGAAPTRGTINTIPAPQFHDGLTGHSSALAAVYLRELLGMPKPPAE